MDKGTRVRVVKGRKHKDAVGTVFWEGPDKYKEGRTRLGLHGDDGETIWVPADYVVELTADDPDFQIPAPPEPPEKGARVAWSQGDDTGTGVVFWVGESKTGPGVRVGLTDDASGESLWFDARQVEPVDDVGGDDDDDGEDIPF